MGVPDGRVGPLCSATPAQLLARVLLPSHPVDALHAVHQDGMALARLMVTDDGHLDAEDRRDSGVRTVASLRPARGRDGARRARRKIVRNHPPPLSEMAA